MIPSNLPSFAFLGKFCKKDTFYTYNWNKKDERLQICKITTKFMIIGAGPGGLMAARTAAQRGHNVTVYDKDTHFGEVFRSAAYHKQQLVLS